MFSQGKKPSDLGMEKKIKDKFRKQKRRKNITTTLSPLQTSY